MVKLTSLLCCAFWSLNVFAARTPLEIKLKPEWKCKNIGETHSCTRPAQRTKGVVTYVIKKASKDDQPNVALSRLGAGRTAVCDDRGDRITARR